MVASWGRVHHVPRDRTWDGTETMTTSSELVSSAGASSGTFNIAYLLVSKTVAKPFSDVHVTSLFSCPVFMPGSQGSPLHFPDGTQRILSASAEHTAHPGRLRCSHPRPLSLFQATWPEVSAPRPCESIPNVSPLGRALQRRSFQWRGRCLRAGALSCAAARERIRCWEGKWCKVSNVGALIFLCVRFQ